MAPRPSSGWTSTGTARFEFGLLVQGVHNPLGDWLVTNSAQSGTASSARWRTCLTVQSGIGGDGGLPHLRLRHASMLAMPRHRAVIDSVPDIDEYYSLS
jgi:hypothetical protein